MIPLWFVVGCFTLPLCTCLGFVPAAFVCDLFVEQRDGWLKHMLLVIYVTLGFAGIILGATLGVWLAYLCRNYVIG